MIEMLKPKSGEDIYDPTCGSGGMLISSLHHIKQSGGEHRNIGLYGQEINLLTSAIARMNLFLHGVEDFHIERGDTLGDPKFVEGGALKQFDLVLANPPYSIKQWDRAKWASDKWGRNKYGTPLKAMPTMRSSNTSLRARNQILDVQLFSTLMEFCSETKRKTCVRRSSLPTS